MSGLSDMAIGPTTMERAQADMKEDVVQYVHIHTYSVSGQTRYLMIALLYAEEIGKSFDPKADTFSVQTVLVLTDIATVLSA